MCVRQMPEADSIVEFQAEARRLRRQRKMDQIEIPGDQLTLTDELLGKGGFGSVYITDYNGRNVAAKVSRSPFSLKRRRGLSDQHSHTEIT